MGEHLGDDDEEKNGHSQSQSQSSQSNSLLIESPAALDPDEGTHGLAHDNDNEDEANGAGPPAEPPSESPVASPGEPRAGDAPDPVPPPYSIFTLWEKRFIVLGASLSAFFSPLTAQIYLPALNVLAKDFNVSASKMNLTVTTYMVFQGITPMFVGGFADTAGRRPAYVFCFVVYIAANIGLALSNNYVSLIVVRCLQSAGSASTVALCQAVVADTITSAERGQYIGITVLPIVLAPSLGPVLGGILSQYLGWRAIFWFLTILAAICLVLMLLFFPETCRAIVGDGSIRPHPAYRTVSQLLKDRYRRRKAERSGNALDLQRTNTSASRASRRKLKVKFGNPLNSLFLLFEKELGLLLSYSAIVFAGFYAIATAMPSQFAEIYGFDDLKVGLMYLPMAGGSLVAAFIVGPTMNWNYRRHAAKLGLPVDKRRQEDLSKFPIERARLEIGLPLLALATGVLLSWGWALQYRASVAVPCVLLFLMGVGMIGFNNTSNVLIVDIYPGKAGAATASNNLSRCLLGAVASAVIVPMINAMGSGWAFTLIGLLYLVFAPVLLLIMKYGIKWRKEIRDKEERRMAAKAEKKSRQQPPHDEVADDTDEPEPSARVEKD
ncbi:putative major facilitator superfamily transporter protein [Phaeoacremonium minimum UCRPA7]|uniref:Putative major facilitator superfamily transporter protein n=1 Tax=Phaeoacremonium minimum (strain UCR-PA7) TaxID=1286976 RepID=R8BM89_PHAM7|nr:putative major facilitator superfamily transporter protein [Phaeoacremonium minimum UCRPA7]EOO00447.1 putative major facilitator superfamily transporter protein [Phaeoacremonium minimum UCRPA7]